MKATLFQCVCIASIATASLAAIPPPHRYTRQEWAEIRARLVVTPVPNYPGVLRQAHYTGTGLFRIYFDERGEVSGIRILKSTGHTELDVETLKALGRWRARSGPKWEMDIPVSFRIGGRWPYSPIDRW